MTTGQWILVAVAVICVAIALQIWFRPKGHRPLAHRQPKLPKRETPLGSEATDLDMIARITRENEALAKKTGADGKDISWIETKSASHRPPD